MKMKLRTIVTILLALAISAFPGRAAHINMMQDDGLETEIPSTVVFAVQIEGFYYTVVVDEGVVKKVELGGKEEPEFTIETDFATAIELVTNYNQMTWLDKVQFLVVRMKVPYSFIASVANGGVLS